MNGDEISKERVQFTHSLDGRTVHRLAYREKDGAIQTSCGLRRPNGGYREVNAKIDCRDARCSRKE